MTYVPEGEVEPPSGHMRWAGTLSLPEPLFAAVLEATARSLRAHGFTLICFVGDSGGNQAAQALIAERLNAAWRGSGARVLHVGDYYEAGNETGWLLDAGETEDTIGRHAGILDTSQVIAAYPSGVRKTLLATIPGACSRKPAPPATRPAPAPRAASVSCAPRSMPRYGKSAAFWPN